MVAFHLHDHEDMQVDDCCPDGDSLVRVGPMVNIAPVLSELGADPVEVFGRVGLDPQMYADPDMTVTYLRSGRLLAECAAATGCDYFGLLLGQASQPSHLGIVGFLVRTAECVGVALRHLAEYLDLHDRGGAVTLHTEGDYCRLSFHIHQLGMDGVDQVYDLCAAILQGIMQSLCGPRWTATDVSLPRRRPADEVPYRRLFRTLVRYDADQCSLLFPRETLERNSPTGDTLLFRHLQEEADLLHRVSEPELANILPAVIREALLSESFSAEVIAQRVGLTERTLHRQLKAAGTTFRAVLDRERMTVAMQLLASTTLAVGDIAQSVGYADSSSFTRAFRRWSGVAPSAWRKQAPVPRTNGGPRAAGRLS